MTNPAALPDVVYDGLPGFPEVSIEFRARELAALEREFGSIIALLQASVNQPNRVNLALLRQGLRRWSEGAKWSPGKLQAKLDDLPGRAITKELGEALWDALKATLPEKLVEALDPKEGDDEDPPREAGDAPAEATGPSAGSSPMGVSPGIATTPGG